MNKHTPPASRIAALAYQPPPGPPDPPKPQTCPHGHALVWISPQVALCDGQDWELLWELEPARACHGASVRAVVLPAALAVAHRLRELAYGLQRIERLEAALTQVIEVMRREVAEIDADGDYCCALTRRYDAAMVEAALAEEG